MVHVVADADSGPDQVCPAFAVAGSAPCAQPFAGVGLLDHRAGSNDLSRLFSWISRPADLFKASSWRRIVRSGNEGTLASSLPCAVDIEDNEASAGAVPNASDQGLFKSMLEKIPEEDGPEGDNGTVKRKSVVVNSPERPRGTRTFFWIARVRPVFQNQVASMVA